MSDAYRGRYYAKAQNLSRQLTAEYDVLLKMDVLAMPTTPQTAHEKAEELSRLAVIDRVLNVLPDTAPFDVTGRPAVSVPAGTADGLPVGLMLAGRRFEDATVFRAAAACEGSVGWALG